MRKLVCFLILILLFAISTTSLGKERDYNYDSIEECNLSHHLPNSDRNHYQ